MRKTRLLLTIGLLWLCSESKSLALSPPEDIPEEVLRSEIIMEGRSALDGQSLNVAEYTSLVQGFGEAVEIGSLDPKIQSLIFDLTLLKLLTGILFF